MSDSNVILAADILCRSVDFDLDQETAEEIVEELSPVERAGMVVRGP